LSTAATDHNMRILVTGNMGYVGPVVVNHLHSTNPDDDLSGFDAGYFSPCLLEGEPAPERLLQRQFFGDLRCPPKEILAGVQAVVHLAGISNDPIGNTYQDATVAINGGGTALLGRMAKDAGVRNFVFASSCSVYGSAEEGARTESSAVSPLTAYARSKVQSENDLCALADEGFLVTCLRFSTACGPSPRIRLDLVLNDFVATALRTGEVRILSDGTPWRPLIDVRDMARAIEWAARRQRSNGGTHVIVNVGSNAANYQVKDLATAVAARISGTRVRINPEGAPDRRSYKVSFDLFGQLAQDHQAKITLDESIDGLSRSLTGLGSADETIVDDYIRLKTLARLRDRGLLSPDLRWT
jgi:nucleoside-diphosphate-sugar epimerase